MTILRVLASMICEGLFILIVWCITGLPPNSWKCFLLVVSANLMVLPELLVALLQGRKNRKLHEINRRLGS